MNLAIFGVQKFTDYYKIGGFESFVRRFATELTYNGRKVHYVLYDAVQEKEIKISDYLIVKYFINYEKAINSITDNYDVLISTWINRKNRLAYWNFCRKKFKKTKLFFFWLNFPDKFYKRILKLIELKLFSLYGKIICISPRQYKYLKRWIKNAIFILPPVPYDYFLTPSEKPINNKIKVTFLGELTTFKYVEEVIQFFNWLVKKQGFDCAIYGTYDPENKISAKIHEYLERQGEIKYIYIPKQNYSPEVDEMVKTVLKDTDVFIQPYKSLVNTLDTPLLLLEAMASLCAVVTTPVGSISQIYGESQFLIREKNFLEGLKRLFENLTYTEVLKERERIFKRNLELKFNSKEIYKAFKEVLQS